MARSVTTQEQRRHSVENVLSASNGRLPEAVAATRADPTQAYDQLPLRRAAEI